MSTPPTDHDPLSHSDYFLGPIETIVCSYEGLASGRLSLHDITEAYRTLSMRIRHSLNSISIASGPLPALEPLRANSTNVIAAWRRDISRTLRAFSQHTSHPSSVCSEGRVSWGPGAYNVIHANDCSTQCHYVLRLLSEIFRFPVLFSIFSSQDLGFLFEDVIALICCSQPPFFSASKTTLLASWVVRTQRLPADILVPRMEDVILCLKRLLEATIRDPHADVAVLDALNCIANLLRRHRHIFIAHLTCLLPLVLPFIIHPSSKFRHHATFVLASFSQTLITHRTLIKKEAIEIICLHTNEFLTPETTRHPTSSRKLSPLLDEAISSKTFGKAGENAAWASTVLASFAVLLGPSLFSYHGPLKLAMNTSQKILRHRSGRDLNPHIWRTFIWSMSQLYTQQSSSADGDMDTVKRCVLILKQTLHNGLGAALIASLLGPLPPDFRNKCIQKWAISSAMDIIRDMLSRKSQNLRHEASRLLACLIQETRAPSSMQRETEWTADLLLSGYLFDGSLLRADKRQVEELVRPIPVFSPRHLSREEIVVHWESVSSCFTLLVHNCLEDGDAGLTTTASAIWQSLLLSQRQPIQGDCQLISSPEFAAQLSSLLLQFLPEHPVLLSGEAKSVESQLRSLVVSRQLWVVIQDTFSQSWLTTVASSFLAAILQHTFHLADPEVLRNWSLLCSHLIVVGIPNVLEIISHQDESQGTLEIKRQLWRLVATDCHSSWLDNCQNVVSILTFPICSWNMSEDDLDIWERVFERSFSAATTSIKPVNIIDDLAGTCPTGGPSFSVHTTLRVALAIFRQLSLNEEDPVPARALSFLNMTLTTSYPPQSGVVETAVKLIKAVHQVMICMPISLLEPIVFAVQRGLALWIEDKSVSLSDEQYNELLMPLYNSLLKRLELLQLTAASFNALAPLLTAAFSRIPPPALGPAAFMHFFQTVHSRIVAPSIAYSDELHVCIDACVRVYGGEWPSGITPLDSSSSPQLITKTPTPLEVCEDMGEQSMHIPSIEHEVIPDSQSGILNAALYASSQARSTHKSLQGSRPPTSILASSQQRPCAPQVVTDSKKRRGSPVASKSARSRNKGALGKRHLQQAEGMPAAKRNRLVSIDGGSRARSAPPIRLSPPVGPDLRSRSTPKATQRERLVMDCVEVVSFREILRLRGAETERDDERMQQEDAPETPFVPRMTRERLERDEIVPETPDALLRLTSPTCEISYLGRGNLTGRNRPLERHEGVSMAFTWLGTAALHDVDDVFLHPGVSQFPAEEVAG